MSFKEKLFVERIDWLVVFIYLLLCLIGIACIFSVEHRSTDITFFLMKQNYMKQIIFFGVSLLIGLIILILDSKIFTSIPFLGYTLGFFLLLLALTPLGKGVKGSHSWLNLGFLTFQPGELMKLFTALTIAKFLTLQDTNFATLKHRVICAAFAIVPMLIIILQNETGLALVYLSFFFSYVSRRSTQYSDRDWRVLTDSYPSDFADSKNHFILSTIRVSRIFFIPITQTITTEPRNLFFSRRRLVGWCYFFASLSAFCIYPCIKRISGTTDLHHDRSRNTCRIYW